MISEKRKKLMELPRVRSEAKDQGEKFYFTNRKCANGHIEKRLTSNGMCVGCRRASVRKYYNKWLSKEAREAGVIPPAQANSGV